MFPAETEIIGAIPHRKSSLCGNNQVVPSLALQPVTEDFFGYAGRVDIRRVNKVAAGRNEAVQHLVALLLRCFVVASECHSPQAKLADPEPGPTQVSIFHD